MGEDTWEPFERDGLLKEYEYGITSQARDAFENPSRNRVKREWGEKEEGVPPFREGFEACGHVRD